MHAASTRNRFAVLFSLAAVLAACGGAGSDGAAVTRPDAASSQTATTARIDPSATPASPTTAPPTEVPSVPAPEDLAVPTQPEDPSSEAPTAGRACEDELVNVDELGALGTDCDVARQVAADFDAKVLALGEVPDEPMEVGAGWTCAKTPSDFEEIVHVGCHQRDASVTFAWGT